MRLRPETVTAALVWIVVAGVVLAVLSLSGALLWFWNTFIAIR